jgi:hypothetical protein
LLLLFIKDLLVMSNQYFWWASNIWDPGCPGTSTPLLDFTFISGFAILYTHPTT